MALRKVLFTVCLVLSVLCLAAGYCIVRQWIGAAMVVIIGLTWLFARKHPASELPHICLLASVCMAVAGLLTGSSPWLMICGSGIALAVWDLLLLDAALGSHSSEGQARQYETEHLRSLAIALGSGIFIAFLGRLLTIRIHFVLLVLFVVLAAFSLDRVWGQIKKQHSGR